MAFILDDLYVAGDPEDLYAYCLENNLQTKSWFGLVNHFTNILGSEPGTGKLILSRKNLNDIKLDGNDEFRSLTINDNRAAAGGVALGSTIKIQKVMLVAHEVAIAPGHQVDDNTPYIVTLADPRWLFWDRGEPITQNYNLRDHNGNYLSETLNGTTPWTWTEILTDLWVLGNLDLLGVQPLLPFTPNGTPENWIFKHDYPLNAIKYFLDRLACALKYDQTKDTVSIVRLGDSSAANTLDALKLETAWKPNRRVDSYAVTPRAASYPKTLRIEFPVRAIYDDGRPNVTTLDRTVSPASAAFNKSFLNLEDDLTALRPPDAFSNLATLGTRADERQSHWQHKRTNHDTGIYREYANTIDFTPALGCYYAGSVWEDRLGERGILTTLFSGKNYDRQIEDWKRRIFDELCCTNTGGEECCDPNAILGGDITGCCPPPLGGGDGGGTIPPPPPGCCNASLYYVCIQQFAPGNHYQYRFDFIVCPNGTVTFVRAFQNGVGFATDAGSSYSGYTAGQNCGSLPQGVNLTNLLIANVPGGVESYCGGGVIPPPGGGNFADCVKKCQDAATAAGLVINSPEWAMVVNACIQAKCAGANAKTMTPSAGCPGCGNAPAETPTSGGCHCNDSPTVSPLVEKMLGGFLGDESMEEYLLSQVGVVPSGVPSVKASGDFTAQSATITVATYTVGASDGSFLISAYLNVVAITGNIKLQAQWFDETNTSRSADLNVAVTVAGGVTVSPLGIRAFAGSAINLITAGAIVSINYNVGGEIVQTR